MRFAVLACAAALAAALSDSARARRFARAPVLVILVALGALGAASAAWTVGLSGDALRWGLTATALAALAFAAAVLVRDRADAVLAGGLIAVVAVAAGLVGVVAAAETLTPLAHREAGRWRPGSTFQYSPALALVLVSALPTLLAGMVRARRPWPALAAAGGGAVSAAGLALAESRTQLAFALIVGAAALAWPGHVADGPGARGRVGAALALVAATGLGVYAVAGGYIPLTPEPDGTARLLAIGAVIAGGALAWLGVRAALARGLPAAAAVVMLLAGGLTAAAVKPAPRLISSGIAPPASATVRPTARAPAPHPVRDQLLHGRLDIWRGAIETFADRPLQGGGADSYLFASARHQGPRSVLFAHDLPLEIAAELGIAGLLLALALYGAAARALWRCRGGPAGWLLWPAAAAFLCANLVDWPWHLAGAGAVWALAFGGVLGLGGATRDGG